MTRLPSAPTQRIDRQKSLSFTYCGKAMQGFDGDNLASALFAQGVRIFSRSLKYHRPRGLYSLDGESANTLVAVDGVPNLRAEQTLLRQGMSVEPQNFKGSVENDRLGFIDKLDGLMPAGFYYRMFHKPYRLWPMISKRLRQAAGIGTLNPDKTFDAHRYPELYLNCEVAVLGGGPAGMSAAIAAAQKGLRVVLVEGRPWLGGFYDWRTRRHQDSPLYERGRDLARQAEGLENLRVMTHAFVTNLAGDNLVVGFEVGGPEEHFDERYFEIRAQAVVVATGCLERPLLFEHNERPGVMQVACAQRLAATYAVAPGQRAVFSVGDDLGLEAALFLAQEGVEVACVADARREGQDESLLQDLAGRGIPVLTGWVAQQARGKKQLQGVTLTSLDGVGQREFDCDLLVASAGQSSNYGPLSTVGARLALDRHTNMFLPVELPPRVHPAGRLLGLTDPGAIEASGRKAGLAAAGEAGADCAAELKRAEDELKELPGPAKGCDLIAAPGISGRKAFVCFDDDATLKAVRQSADQGMDQPELAKRFAGIGLGPGQSGVPGHNLPLVMARLRGEEPGGLMPTTVRSPLVPMSFATVAGPQHDIFKRTPLHPEQEAAGAVFRRVGVWKRARYFSQDLTSAVEILAVRTGVGVIDVSTLGKFRLFGPDAEKALQRVYISNMTKVKEGRLKYSAMCNLDGCLLDDGVVTKLGDNDYYFTTSTGRAGSTIEWFRYHARYENWDFNLVNLTDALGALNLAGPQARRVLAKLTDADVSNQALPYMGFAQVMLKGKVPAKVLRVGFVGELGYELHVPASWCPVVWSWIMEAGREFDIRPFGLEAQFVLRLEKGHVIIGQESEQRTTLLDLGLGFLWDRQDYASKKVGAPALRFAAEQTGRLKLVGFTAPAGQGPKDGAVVYQGGKIEGFVCSSRHSVTLDKTVGLALVRDHLAQEGNRLDVFQYERSEKRLAVTVTKPPFYDPQGKRLRM